MGWGGFSHFVTSTFPPALFKSFRGEAVFADSDELPHQEPNHSIQKAAGLNLNAQEISVTLDVDVLDGCS
jgi:hypothetical protein